VILNMVNGVRIHIAGNADCLPIRVLLKWFIHLVRDEYARRATMPGRGPCPNVGITTTAVPAHEDHRSPNRKQRLSLKQVGVPMSQMGRMSFAAAGVIMGK
jgi:hypothetical protein